MKMRWLATSLIFAAGVVSAQTQTPPPAKKPAQPAQGTAGTAPSKAGAAPTTETQTSSSYAPRPANQKPPVEEIAARVNGEIITNVELLRSQAHDVQEITDDCSQKKCTPDELQKALDEGKRDALRGLIDTALLVQRAKDLELSVETELVKQLDETRLENKLDSMEALQKAVESEGMDWEEYKTSVRNQFLAQDVIYREVGSKVSNSIDRGQIQKYYDEHKDEFTLPETVRIREILVSTTGKPESDWPNLEKKANQLRERVLKNGEDFGEMAKHFSDGGTAHQGGELGAFERGKLDPKIEVEVFKLNRNEMTPVMHTANGFMILQIVQRYEAGVQPLDKVEQEVSSHIASSQMPARLRVYLTTLRRDSFVEVRPGYVDTGATGTSDNSIAEAKNPLDEPIGKLQRGPKKHKKLWIF
jgi:peptidyl-prolyl cis-trans isomerase SurA